MQVQCHFIVAWIYLHFCYWFFYSPHWLFLFYFLPDTYGLGVFQKLASQYLRQIIAGLQMQHWMVTRKNKILDDYDTRHSCETFIGTGLATIWWGEVSHAKSIDGMQQDLVYKSKSDGRIPRRLGDKKLKFTDQEAILRVTKAYFWRINRCKVLAYHKLIVLRTCNVSMNALLLIWRHRHPPSICLSFCIISIYPVAWHCSVYTATHSISLHISLLYWDII